MSTPSISNDSRVYICNWCGRSFDPVATSCPACGAPVDVRKAVTASGWQELEAVPDMAKIQLGQSFCQIEGTLVPVADFKLAAGDGVYFAHHLMLWKDDQTQTSAMSFKGSWNRMVSGLPLVMMQAMGPGRIAFSKDKPGELIAVPMNPGQSIDVREHVFITATHSVTYDWFDNGIWFKTAEDKSSKTNYPIGMFMDRFTAGATPGLLLMHGAGNVFTRTLTEGQHILIKPTSLLFKETTVRMNLCFEHPGGTDRSSPSSGNLYMWLGLHGPGRIAVQSDFEPVEDPGSNLQLSEPNTTYHNW